MGLPVCPPQAELVSRAAKEVLHQEVFRHWKCSCFRCCAVPGVWFCFALHRSYVLFPPSPTPSTRVSPDDKAFDREMQLALELSMQESQTNEQPTDRQAAGRGKDVEAQIHIGGMY